jgi:hypothetical protein
MISHTIFTPQTQSSEHPIPVAGETLPIPNGLNYPPSDMGYLPHSERFQVVNAVDCVSRFGLVTPRVAPAFEARPPAIYHEDVIIDNKPIPSRILNPIQDRISWDFLGLEH